MLGAAVGGAAGVALPAGCGGCGDAGGGVGLGCAYAAPQATLKNAAMMAAMNEQRTRLSLTSKRVRPGRRVVQCRVVDSDFFALARTFLLRIVPLAARELRTIKRRAERIPDSDLRREALASISAKDFHVHGGCILATFLEPPLAQSYVQLVAMFETAVDYLDNLCDRMGMSDEADFRTLHGALLDAIEPGASPRAYFGTRARDDGGYLTWLVVESQRLFAALPAFEHVREPLRAVTERYCELQALKHLPASARERRCVETFGAVANDLAWWEGAAACGSTMPSFALAYGAARGCSSAQANDLYHTYFPYISAFHILLDYFIDQAEDRAHGELNFVACYPDRDAARDGLARIGRQALAAAGRCANAREHVFAVKAMCGFYCSRPEVEQQSLTLDARAIAQAVGVDSGGQPWSSATSALIAPLLRLYRRVSRV